MSFSKPVNVKEFIDNQKKKTTLTATQCHIKLLQRFLIEEKTELRPFHEINATELDQYLAEFFIVLKKADGQDYEPSSIDCVKFAIERALKDEYYPWSICKDREFQRTRAAINAKKIQLKKNGLGRKRKACQAISKLEEERLLNSGDESPFSLQFTIFYQFTKGFGLRGRDEHRSMRFGDVSVKKTTAGKKFLELAERNSKTMDGTKRHDMRDTTPKIFETGTEKCPVKMFEKFVERRPIAAISPDYPMYITPIPTERLRPHEKVWYYKCPMGRNTLGDLVKKMCLRTGIEGKKTNHSIRKTCVRALSDAGVPAHKIIKITGHKNVSSLSSYDRELSDEEHIKLSDILTNKATTTASSAIMTSESASCAKEHSVEVEDVMNSQVQQVKTSTPKRPSAVQEDGTDVRNSQVVRQSIKPSSTHERPSAQNPTNPTNENNIGRPIFANRGFEVSGGALERLFCNATFNNCTFTINIQK